MNISLKFLIHCSYQIKPETLRQKIKLTEGYTYSSFFGKEHFHNINFDRKTHTHKMSSYDIPQTTPGGGVPLPTTNENNIDTLNKKTMILSRWANAHRLFDDDRSESDSDNENVPGNEGACSADGPDASNRDGNVEENGERETTKGRASLKLYMLTMVVSISRYVTHTFIEQCSESELSFQYTLV